MAIAKTKTDLIGTQASKTTITAGSSSTSSSLDCSTYVGILVGMEVVFGGSPDDTTQLEVQTSPDNSTWDTEAYALFEIDEDISTTKMKTMRIGPEAKYIRVKVTNNDSTDSVSVWAYAVGMTT
jgi:hypothetical protein